MEINVEVTSGADSERVSVMDETVEVVDAGGEELRPGAENPPGLVSDQQLIVAHPQEVLVPSTEVSCLCNEAQLARYCYNYNLF